MHWGGRASATPAERPQPLRDSLVVLGLGVIGVHGVESSKRLRVGRLVDGQPAVDAEHLTGNEACAVAAEERDAVRDIDRLAYVWCEVVGHEVVTLGRRVYWCCPLDPHQSRRDGVAADALASVLGGHRR